MKLTTGNKRFLIVWLGICVFAYFVNLYKIEGTLGKKVRSRIWTSNINNDDFYPFTPFFENEHSRYSDYYDSFVVSFDFEPVTVFRGLFNSFNLPEFIFYIFLGLSIVFIPKLWKQ